MSDSIYQELTDAFNHVVKELPNNPINVLLIGMDSIADFISTDKIVFVDHTGLTYDGLIRALKHTQPLVEYMEQRARPLVIMVTQLPSESFPMLSTLSSVDTRQNVSVIQNNVDSDWCEGNYVVKEVYFKWLMG